MTETTATDSSQWGWWVAVVFVLQILFFWVGSKDVQKTDSSSQLGLMTIEGSNVLDRLALEDPMALSQPNKHGFSGVWLKPVPMEHKLTRWTPPDIPLPKEPNLIENIIAQVLEEGPLQKMRSFVKPAPKLTRVNVPFLGMKNLSRLELEGDLKTLVLDKPVALRSGWETGTLLRASRVQVMVSVEGKILNGALIQSSGHDPADQKAVDIALRGLSFQKSTNGVVAGNLVFYWHTNPVSITNIIERPR
jgi:hypothetical protein